MKNKINKMVKALVALFAFAFAGAAMADTWTDISTGLTWTYRVLEDGTAEICDYDSESYVYNAPAVDPEPEGALAIPATLGGRTVTRVGENALSNCGNVTSVTIPASVKSIGGAAFWHCWQMKSVTMPGVKEIDKIAFQNCNSLSSVTMPDDVTILESGVFGGCPSLADETDEFVIINGVLYGRASNAGVFPKDVVIPATVTRIANFAFYSEGDSVRSVTIPGNVQSIGDHAFSGCDLSEGVVIQKGVQSIGVGAFYRSNVKSVVIPGSVESIGESAFADTDLTSVWLNSGVETLDASAFRAYSLKRATIPHTVTTVESAGIFSGVETIYVEAGDTARVKEMLPFTDSDLAAIDFVEMSDTYVYAVRLDANGGICGATSIRVKKGAAAGDLPAALRVGYTFDGWYNAKTSGTKIDETTTVSGNATYYAHWTPQSYTLWFMPNGGEVTPNETKVTYGSAYGTLPVPTISDGALEFDGWYTADDGGTKVTASTTVSIAKDHYLYAHWKDKSVTQYTVTFDKNGGDSVSESSRTVESGEAIGTPLPTASRSGWNFDGWFTKASGGTQIDGTETVTGNVTYYAHWTDLTPESKTETVDGITWTYRIVDGEAEIYNNGFDPAIPNTTAGEIIVPSTLGGCLVTRIGGHAFYHCDKLTGVTIQSGVTSIGFAAFIGCTALVRVTMPEGLASIEDSAFYECAALEDAAIPESVTSIGNAAFAKCEALADANGFVIIRGILCYYCGPEKDVTIPAGVTRIGWGALASSESVIMPNGVVSIEPYAFYTPLTEVTIPSSVTEIAKNAFYGCWHLETVHVEKGDTGRVRGLIEGSGFDEPLTYVDDVLPPTTMYTVTFDKNGGDSVSEASRVVESGATIGTPLPTASRSGWNFVGWFTTAGGETQIDGTETVTGDVTYYAHWTEIETEYKTWTDPGTGIEWTYRVVDGEAEIYNDDYPAIPDTTAGAITVPSTLGGYPVTRIGDWAFDVCELLTSVTVPSGVTSIGSGAFSECYGLESVSLPEGLETINDGAFLSCESLETISIPSTVTSIGDGVFQDCYALADDDGFIVVSGILFDYQGTASDVTVPSTATKIWDSALYRTPTMVSLDIPGSVKSIGWDAFGDSVNLASVTFGRGVKTIGEVAFIRCAALTEARIPASVTSIGESAFGETALNKVYVEYGDTARVKTLLEASYFDTTGVEFVEDAEPLVCTVTLELNGGSGIPTTLEVEPGEQIGLLPIPDGYDDGIYKYHNFYGWFWDAGFTDEVEPTDVVSGDCTCYAKWGLSPDLQTTVVDGIAWSYFEVGKTVTLYNNGRSVIPSDYEGSLTIPAKIAGKTVAGIGMCAFYGCTGLTSVIIPDGVEDISDKAFAWCENLQVVQFGKGTAKGTIFLQAFKGCAKLRALDFKATTPVYAVADAFEDAGTMTGEGKPCVYVPKSAAKNWGDTWMGMRVLPYSYYANIVMDIASGKDKYGSITPVASGTATEIGKKVTLKAKANKTYVFAGWYDLDTGVRVSRSASYTYTVTGEDKRFEADFVDTGSDIDSLHIDVYDVWTADDGSATIDIGAAVSSYSEPKITVKGLPAGLKYDSKTQKVTGKATKPGKYTVTVSATSASVKKAKTADFTIAVPNFTDALIPVADEYGPYIPGVEYVETISAAAGCKVSGLPAGMKWTDKDIYAKTSMGVVYPVAYANSAYGAPTKPGSYTVYFTKTVDKVKHTATATFTVGPFPHLSIITEGGNVKDKATGAGDYAANKKVSLKATADKGHVFSGWFDEFGKLVSRAASYSYTMPSEDTVLKAKFIDSAYDAAHVTATLSGVGSFDKDHTTASKTVYCGVYEEWKLEVDAESATTVKVSGLPAGLKFTAKDVVDSKTKKVIVEANTIYGAPSAASKTGRDGYPVPSAVKISITTAGKTKVDYTANVLVEPMTIGLYGQFEGGGDDGQATLTVTDKGKISGKYLSEGLTWTLAAPYFDSFDDGTTKYTATLEAKSGSGAKAVVETLNLEIGKGANSVTEAKISDSADNEIARLYLANWKDSAWKSVATDFGKSQIVDCYGSDKYGRTYKISMKFASTGKVTVTGIFNDSVTASGSSTLAPTCFPHDFANGKGTAKVSVYLPPNTKKGFNNAFAEVFDVVWDGTNFSEAD